MGDAPVASFQLGGVWLDEVQSDAREDFDFPLNGKICNLGGTAFGFGKLVTGFGKSDGHKV